MKDENIDLIQTFAERIWTDRFKEWSFTEAFLSKTRFISSFSFISPSKNMLNGYIWLKLGTPKHILSLLNGDYLADWLDL